MANDRFINHKNTTATLVGRDGGNSNLSALIQTNFVLFSYDFVALKTL